jgi:hypothetical protein
MAHIEMYLWYPLIAVQWNRCDLHSRLTFNYLLKGPRLNSGMPFIFPDTTLHEVCLIPILGAAELVPTGMSVEQFRLGGIRNTVNKLIPQRLKVLSHFRM